MKTSPRLLLGALGIVALLSPLIPTEARACGGTFCDGVNVQPNQPPMPVDQSGETILFASNGDSIEAHVQIQYTGNPSQFGWVVPVQSVPLDIKPSSQQLFDNVLQATVPTFQTPTPQNDVCSTGSRASSSSDNVGCGSSAASESSADTASPTSGAAGGTKASSDNGPDVVSRQVVGSFVVTTVKGGTADGLVQWLNDNGLVTPPNLETFLKGYLEQNYAFVAIKLRAGAGLNEIHPIMFKYAGNKPCIPLKLTAVAAKENMGVRAIFLADGRFVPSNYKHVVPADLQFNWLNQGGTQSNAFGNPTPSPGNGLYDDVISKAVDTDVAGGRAFVTEYAGVSNIVSRSGITSPNWRSAPLATATPDQVPQLLANQHILSCSGGTCQSPHPLVLPLLREFLPVPVGKQEGDFYSCPSCIKQSAGAQTFVASAFAKVYEDSVVGPSNHAEDLLIKKPYLTRLFTTISPAEMTEDPEFIERPDLPDVKVRLTPVQRTTCENFTLMVLPDSQREVVITTPKSFSQKWPTFPDDMPWAERVEVFGESGPATVLEDNKATIDAKLLAFNQPLGWPVEPEFQVDRSSSCTYHPVSQRRTSAGLFGLLLGLGLLRRGLRRSR
jgi:hypothetical protein